MIAIISSGETKIASIEIFLIINNFITKKGHSLSVGPFFVIIKFIRNKN